MTPQLPQFSYIKELLAQGDSFWLPPSGSSFSGQVDWLFHFIFWISAFFFTLIAVLMVVFVIRYRRREGQADSHPKAATHNTALELTWTIIPLILVLIIFVISLKTYINMTTPPANVYEINVTAFKWDWAFTYPNGHVDADLHIPVNRPIRLVLTSQDVIHSLFIPAFRIKKDAVPGRYNQTWFEATKVNTDPGYPLFCAEYCGTQHSTMLARVYVHEPNDFLRWLEEASDWQKRMTPAQRGEQIHKSRGCNQCHSLDGTRLSGPTFQNLIDRATQGQTTFQDGTVLSNLLSREYTIEQYIHESIVDPANKVVAGYDNVMPSFKGNLQDNDIQAMIAYLKTLSESTRNLPRDDSASPSTSPSPAQEQRDQ